MEFKYRQSMDPLMRWEVPTVYEDTPTFLAVPCCRSHKMLKMADVAIVGIPYQGVAPVARQYSTTILTPIKLRQYSVKYGGYLPELDVDVFERLRVVDCGDVPIGVRLGLPQAIDLATARIGALLDAGCLPIVLGGYDLLPCYSAAKAISERAKGDVGTLSLDAHGDNMPEHLGERWSGATWGARMMELPHVRSEKHVQLGMRGPRNFGQQVEWFREGSSRLFTMREVRSRGIDDVATEALDFVHTGTERVVLTVDYDVLDLSCAPGLDEPYGLYVPELLHLMYEAGKSGVDALAIGWIPAPEPGLFAIVIYSILYLLAGEAQRRGAA